MGAGGLSNALPELVHGAGRGARIDLRAAPNEEPGMTPREIWCNEAQERYVLAIAPGQLAAFRALCERERCPFAVVGVATDDHRLEVRDPLFGNTPVDMDLPALLGKPPRMTRDVRARAPRPAPRSDAHGIDARARPCGACCGIPTVADKTFLVTIGDRTRGRPLLARPDGRAVAGAGGRLRHDAALASRATPARPSRSASARRSP